MSLAPRTPAHLLLLPVCWRAQEAAARLASIQRLAQQQRRALSAEVPCVLQHVASEQRALQQCLGVGCTVPDLMRHGPRAARAASGLQRAVAEAAVAAAVRGQAALAEARAALWWRRAARRLALVRWQTELLDCAEMRLACLHVGRQRRAQATLRAAVRAAVRGVEPARAQCMRACVQRRACAAQSLLLRQTEAALQCAHSPAPAAVAAAAAAAAVAVRAALRVALTRRVRAPHFSRGRFLGRGAAALERGGRGEQATLSLVAKADRGACPHARRPLGRRCLAALSRAPRGLGQARCGAPAAAEQLLPALETEAATLRLRLQVALVRVCVCAAALAPAPPLRLAVTDARPAEREALAVAVSAGAARAGCCVGLCTRAPALARSLADLPRRRRPRRPLARRRLQPTWAGGWGGWQQSGRRCATGARMLAHCSRRDGRVSAAGSSPAARRRRPGGARALVHTQVRCAASAGASAADTLPTRCRGRRLLDVLQAGAHTQ